MTEAYQEDDHRGAYVFNGEDTTARPAKRRKTVSSKKDGTPKKQGQSGAGVSGVPGTASGVGFTSLFDGAESAESVRARRELFETAWPSLESKIQHVLREANRNTLDEVSSFIQTASSQRERIPAAFIITGPNIASQDLLFEQLSETLCKPRADKAAQEARFVRLRSAEAPNLKATLRKTIRDATARAGDDDGDEEVSVGSDGRKYLDYDLEALHAALKMQKPQSRQVIVAFQDSEGFDSSLLSDLLGLFHSWRDRIQFAVLFGVATSVELLRARLLKSTAHCLQGGQFDVVQAGSVLESVFKHAIAGTQAKLRLGPGLLRTLIERQHDHVAGIQVFVSSIKYAYMCHFYANPLSMLLAEENREALQPEHLQAVRTLPSFRAHVEGAVEARQLHHAESLLENDEYLVRHITDQRQERQDYVTGLLRSLHLMTATGLVSTAFTDLYISALANGIDLSVQDDSFIESVRRLGPEEIVSLIRNLLNAVSSGSPDLDLPGWESDAEDLVVNLTEIQDEVEALIGQSKGSSRKTALKSKYSAQSKVLRTTVVAQKVQLSHDTATLSETDKAFTKAIDSLTDLLKEHISSVPIESLPVHEAWVYDAKSPYRDVFVPRPGITVGRALSRPHDYLGCACCATADGVAPTMPATAILYHMYQETGALVNVADLWSAYFALVGQPDDSEDGEVAGGGGGGGGGMDERTALVHFYRALAELRTMGFVKPSKKKADHIAKLKWL